MSLNKPNERSKVKLEISYVIKKLKIIKKQKKKKEGGVDRGHKKTKKTKKTTTTPCPNVPYEPVWKRGDKKAIRLPRNTSWL